MKGYNPLACHFFREFDKKFNTKGFYATVGLGEHYVGKHRLDYINLDLKLIIEWDEWRHDRKVAADIKRQLEVMEQLLDLNS